jgi:hypothetical protein
MAGFLALFSKRESADLPQYYTNPSIRDAVARTFGDDLLEANGRLLARRTVGGMSGRGEGGLLEALTSSLPGSEVPVDRVAEDCASLRMNSLCGYVPFVTICLDLLMYEDERLFEAAIEMYVSFFMEIETVVGVLEQVQVLESGAYHGENEAAERGDAVTSRDAADAQTCLALLQCQVLFVLLISLVLFVSDFCDF